MLPELSEYKVPLKHSVMFGGVRRAQNSFSLALQSRPVNKYFCTRKQ